jgi:hypothetical protein
MGKKNNAIPVPEDSDVKNALGAPGDFKQSLVDTLQESNTARSEMKAVLHELLRQEDTRKEIQNLVKELDRDAVKAFWSKFGFTVWSAAVFVAGVAVTIIITKLLDK